MSRDSHISYLHLTKSHHSLYLANWVRDKLPHDDIEAMNFELDEDFEVPTNVQSLSFANMKSKRKGFSENAHSWRNLDLQRFLEQEGGAKYPTDSNARDNTILKKLNIADKSEISSSSSSDHLEEISNIRVPATPSGQMGPVLTPTLNKIGDGGGYPSLGFEGTNPNSVNNITDPPNNTVNITTPEMMRNRPSQRTFSSSFQTPTSRIMR